MNQEKKIAVKFNGDWRLEEAPCFDRLLFMVNTNVCSSFSFDHIIIALAQIKQTQKLQIHSQLKYF